MFLNFISAVLFFVFCASANAEGVGVGIKKLEVADPVDQASMEAVAFFPSSDRSKVTKIGPYQVAASKSSSIGEGRYPLILLSHGNMGSMWGHHDLASALAQHGYIVISVTHPGDNFQDTSRVGASSSIYGRPLQGSAALTSALKDNVLAPHIDANRIGFVGFSAGGTTGLILAGAKPTLSRLEDYCGKRPGDHHVCEARGKIRVDHPELKPTADPRIRSFVLLAPLSVVFSSDELELIKAPFLIFVGDKDEELSPDANATELVRDLEGETMLEVIPDAGHFTFLAPCSPDLGRAMPALCIDHEGVDRIALHQSMNSDIAAFFNKTLGVVSP
ncbi:Predicted dienelactone hydrolase [Rhizobium sp. NFR07]|uniref:alpha/beta hydrolase family protein n=1 Tax=Rhizobium sp. NFR07 TaxID=1566262 RepID=UPI0008E03B1C|nr:dienelactone hydrolase [Rhizobium sp. NFR07]SFB61509.1 Predicted dienelactone hydrolase [Rhizobium sp. NFR07]